MAPSAPAGSLSTSDFYRRWLGPVLSRDEGLDAEQLSRTALTALGQASLRRSWPGISTVLNGVAAELQRRDLRLEQVLFGCRFSNPVGLAAGFDKNAEVFGPMLGYGFGFVECGTVTPRPQAGNPKPRLFRLTEDEAVINRMGFNNDGLGLVVRRLVKGREDPIAVSGVVGANVGANKTSEGDARIADYVAGVRGVWPYCSYITINIS